MDPAVTLPFNLLKTSRKQPVVYVHFFTYLPTLKLLALKPGMIIVHYKKMYSI